MSDLAALARDLGRANVYVGPEVKKALEVTAFKAKESWRDHAKGPSGGHAKAYPFSIDYDVRTRLSHWEAEIGPSLGRKQGALGFLEDAPGGVGAAPQKARPKVIKDVEKDFHDGITKAVSDALERVGL